MLLPKYIYKNFSGTRDVIRHLKTFRVIINEMPALLLILSWCFLVVRRCIQFFNAYFYEQMFFTIFVAQTHRQGIIQEFNLGVGSHVSITLNFAAEGRGGVMGRAVSPLDNSISLTWPQCLVLNYCMLYSCL